jgi:hypothetical protein
MPLRRHHAKLAAPLILAFLLSACGDDGGSSSATSTTTTTSTGTSGGGGAGGGGGGAGAGSPADADGDGYSVDAGDCNDNDASVNPAAPEVCDDLRDNDCDGSQDASENDADGDGFGPCAGDCNDASATVNPAATELPGDGIDNNCDGTVDADFDSDGVTEADGDCNDLDGSVYPGAPELCFDGVDNDCDGAQDASEPDGDGDGFGPCGGDCDDTNPNANPGAPEIASNGIDDNCDYLVDGDADGDGFTVENGDCNDADAMVNPSVLEVCDDLVDNDCDGTLDTDCVTKCELAELFKTSVGCEYFAIDADNFPGYDTLPYAIVVSNTDATDAAVVTVETRSGMTWTAVQSTMVAPGTLHIFNLPDRHIDGSGVNIAGAYRVRSDVPVVAYQFQPIDGVASFTSDASLLLPSSALDRFYLDVGWGKPSAGNAQVAIVVTQDGTQINVTPNLAINAGGGIPALAANAPYAFPVLYNAGDVLQLDTSGGTTTGLSGTTITASKPVSVFTANTCANVPSQICCCDHVEEQLFGLQTWGKTYVAARHAVRNTGPTADTAWWHVIASQDMTTVSFVASPGVTGVPAAPQVLQKGQVVQLGVAGPSANPGDFLVLADKPVLVAQYMSSADATNVSSTGGDPFMAQAVPVEQFLDRYVVLAPPNWINDRMVITKPVGATVTLDGNPVPQTSFVAIANANNPAVWEVARLTVTDGVHTLSGSAPFGVMIHGYDSYDSYGYPGGLNQQVINPLN